MNRKRALRVVLFALSLFVSAVALGGFFGRPLLALAIVQAPNAGRVFRVDRDPSREEVQKLGVTEPLRVAVSDGIAPISLSLWVMEPPREPLGTVLVLHGIRADKSWVTGLGTDVAAEGYRALLVDLPGQGWSSGEWLSYGVREARALKSLLDELEKQGRVVGNVGVVGLSYGAATGIQLGSIDPRVRAVVAVAPFSSLRAVVPGYARKYLPILGWLIPSWFVDDVIDRAGGLAGFDPDGASPLAAIAETRAQVLLIHGEEDTHIPFAQSRELARAAPDHSELVVVPGVDHVAIANDPSIVKHGMPWLHRYLERP